jgi:ADP-ribose diphosphatase
VQGRPTDPISDPGAMMSAERTRILSSKVLYDGKVFGVRRDRVVEPGGRTETRDIVVHRGSVVVLPVFPNGDVLLIRQYRHAAGRSLWELVAGRVEPGERPITAARRELEEESGYSARRLRKMLELFPSPGFVTERMWIFLARELTHGQARPEEDERIAARRFAFPAVERMIRSGALVDGKSVAAILYYERFLR